ncbi:hypothetical protein U1Q18_029305 [Sarracenia purpurea var. burkii]
MGTQNFFSLSSLKTGFDFVEKVFTEEFLYGTMLRLANSFWVFACNCWFYLFGFIAGNRFRLDAYDCPQKNDWDFRDDHSEGDDQIDSGTSRISESDDSGKRENRDFLFGFRFQNSETESSAFQETSPTPNASKYRVMSTIDFRGFMEEPEKMSFTVQELFVGSNDDRFLAHKGSPNLFLDEVRDSPAGSIDSSDGHDQMISRVSVDEDFEEFNSELEVFLPKKAGYSENVNDSSERNDQMINRISNNEAFKEFNSEAEVLSENPNGSVMEESRIESSKGNDQMINRVSNNEDLVEFNSQEELLVPEKPEDSVERPCSISVEESLAGSNDSSEGNDQIINRVAKASDISEDVEQFNSEEDTDLPVANTEDSVQNSCCGNVLEKSEQSISSRSDLHGVKETTGEEDNLSDSTNLSDEVSLISGNSFRLSNSEPETNNSTEDISIRSHKFDSVSNEFSSDEKIQESIEKIPNSEQIRDRAEDTDDEYMVLELNSLFSTVSNQDFENKHETEPTSKNSDRAEDTDDEYMVLELNSLFPTVSNQNFENKHETEPSSKNSEDDGDEFDVLLQHQDLIEQMKAEMKNARGKGLPTILEESETTPKMAEDLKPLQIDEKKFEHKDVVKEIQKVYKSYAERMRKLDVLNYQTLHAISFLQLKDPSDQRSPGQKSSVSTMKSLHLPSLRWSKLRRIYADPTLKSITELHRNLEIVYVGQTCLSWEILHWQHEKAKELLEHDSGDGHRWYDLVAGEFQQFQVLVQRFVESEPFQGPRVQNYAKNRCDLRAFLQVPAIKEDCLKDRKDKSDGVDGEYVIPIAMLIENIDESIRVFWEFLRADRDEEGNAVWKGMQPTHSHLQDPLDSQLLLEIKTSLRKKEKRVKDILRSGNCIVKKFRKQNQGGGRIKRDLLFAQVELKLVSRVLNMSRLTRDQLVWCQNKLNRISFFNRKIQVDPSFLLFPF